jgi:hypothetical protein
VRFLRVSLLLSTVGFLSLAGCRQEDDISRETVEHPDREKIRLRVAVIKQGPSVWFIKMAGPVKLVEEHGKTFEDLVRGARFDGALEPILITPKGWKKDLPTRMRFAGFRTGEKAAEMEIAVTDLPAKSFDLMVNMHRWQKQVNVPLTESREQLENQVKREKIADHEVIWVDLQGGLGVHTVSKPPEPMAKNAKNPFKGLEFKKAGAGGGGGKVPFKYTVPDGWEKKAPGQFAAEAYLVGGKAVVTLTPAGGDLTENINRWRAQVDLGKLPADELKKTITELPVAGIKSFYVDLGNPQSAKENNRTLGVIIPMADATWFIKMSGPHDFVGQHKNAFETFIKSFKLDAR